MNRHVRNVLLIWLALSVLGMLVVANADIFPPKAAEQAMIIDDAFRLLSILALPVAALVLTVLGYSLLRFRVDHDDEEEGPPIYGSRLLSWSWLLISTGLVIFVVFNPGLKGLNELAEAEGQEELVIEVEGEQWHWNVTYPEQDLSYERALQIALPVDKTVRFEITSADVIHSFWIPAFRMKMDALPGKVTTLTVTPDQLGSTGENPHLRAQCAELCGTGHPRMQMDVLILSEEEFAAWVEEARALTAGSDMEMDMDMGGDMEGMEMEEGQSESGMDMDMEMEEGEEGQSESGMDMEMDADAQHEEDEHMEMEE